VSKPLFSTGLDTLLPFQRAFVADESRFKIWCASRQIGKSFAAACEVVRDCQLNPKTHWIILSAGERQALEFMQKVKMWVTLLEAVIEWEGIERDGAETVLKSAEVLLDNESRVTALPANADTARGYSANIVLDEFAFHRDSEKIWRAIYPSITNPLKRELKVRVLSTPNGKANKFYELWTDDGGKWSKHCTTIYDAVANGLAMNIEDLRQQAGDPDTWAQEFECQFIDSAAVLLPYELLATCESAEATEISDLTLDTSNLYLGVDIGRKHDLTVIWCLQRVGDVLWTRGVTVLERLPFSAQLELISAAARHAARVCVDATGIGAMLAEELARRHGGMIEECQFSAALKAEIFTNLRRKFDDKLIRIPVSRAIREDLHGLQKVTGATGSVRYLAPHNEDGHCDRATALALAVHAGKQPAGGPPERVDIRGELRERGGRRGVVL
jgi:phage FluMu gp28-like protein